MPDIKDRPTVELQAEYDANAKQIQTLLDSNEALNAELSRRSNALAFIRNQVIAGNRDVLLANGADPKAVEAAELWVAEWKEMKRQRRAEGAAPEVGGAS